MSNNNVDELSDDFLMESPYTDDIDGVISAVMLKVSGVKNRYNSPTVNPPEMNKELDEVYHKAKAKLNTLIEQRVREARIDELERINGDCLICSDSKKRNDGTFRGQNYEKRLAQLQAQQEKNR